MNRVLILEPSESFAHFLFYILKRLGFEVTHLRRSNQALETLPEIEPEFIITEISLPDLSGIELCRKLKQTEKFSRIPVAIISIDGSIETKQLAQSAGCVDYLTKPVTARDIHELMERHHLYHYKRRNIRARMRVMVKVDNGKNRESLWTLNIGEGGMYIQTDEPYEVRTHVKIETQLPGLTNPLFLEGEVIYTSDAEMKSLSRGMGIKFIGLDQNTTELIKHYLESYISGFLPESNLIDEQTLSKT